MLALTQTLPHSSSQSHESILIDLIRVGYGITRSWKMLEAGSQTYP